MRVELAGNFDYVAASTLRGQVSAGESLEIDLRNSRFVDSEALMWLCELRAQGAGVRLINPPILYFEAVDALGLTAVLKDITKG
jgi:hypothetical protein